MSSAEAEASNVKPKQQQVTQAANRLMIFSLSKRRTNRKQREQCIGRAEDVHEAETNVDSTNRKFGVLIGREFDEQNQPDRGAAAGASGGTNQVVPLFVLQFARLAFVATIGSDLPG